eukprot:GHVS01080684.1.p1 GENE.GHVS01080684.1~~GHVS01080684.1.p1  ORF type:complete len:453 (+),score=92.87 GHVS01080684.1:100-1359(+)
MPPIKKRTLKRYTFDSSKYDFLPHKRHLSNFPSAIPPVDSTGPSESSCLVLEDPSCSPISPLISGLPTDFCLTPEASQEEHVDSHLTGLPPVPAQLSVSTTLDSGEDRAEDCSAQPRSVILPGEEGEDSSERRTVRTERIQQRVRGLVMAQREQVRSNLSGELLLSQKIKTLQLVRKALFVPPRTESEREMRIRSVQKQLRYKQQVKQLFHHVVADIRRIRRISTLRETAEVVSEERRRQGQMSQQLFRRKLQVLASLCSRMTRTRSDALAARQLARDKGKREQENGSMKSEAKKESALPEGTVEKPKVVPARTTEMISWCEEQTDTASGEGWTTSALMRRALGSCVVSGEVVDKGDRMAWLGKGREEQGGFKGVGDDVISEGSSVDILSSQDSQKEGGESSGADSSSESSGSESSADS